MQPSQQKNIPRRGTGMTSGSGGTGGGVMRELELLLSVTPEAAPGWEGPASCPACPLCLLESPA